MAESGSESKLQFPWLLIACDSDKMETDKDKKKSRPPLGDIGNTQGPVQMSGDGHLSPEEDMENIKFMVEVLERVVECEAKAKVASEQIHKKQTEATCKLKKLKEDITESEARQQQDKAALEAKDEEMRKMKEDLEASDRAKELELAASKAKDEEMRKMKEDLEAADRAKELAKDEEMRKMKEDMEAADRAKEIDRAFLKVKDQLLEEMAAGLKNSDRDQVTAAAVRALCASLERTKNERDQMEQERDAALHGKQTALDQLDDAKMQHEADVAAHLDHLNDMGRLFRG